MPALPDRLPVIDILRGLTLALMIVVNMSISDTLSYGQLLHSVWHGLTLTDIVFPTFLFVVGAAMAVTLERYRQAGDSRLIARAARRTLLIFACGIVVSNFPFFRFADDGSVVWQSLADLRMLGVLQRIALTYFCATLLIRYGGRRGAWLYSLAALGAYWALLAGFGDYTLRGNLPLKVDLWAFGAAHLYTGEGIPFDPEGLLGTLPAVVNVLAGYLALDFLRRNADRRKALLTLALAGAAALLLALAWNAAFPINKKLWTSSYVLCTVGIDLLALAALQQAIQIPAVSSGARYFEVFGKNTLAIYMLAEMLMSLAWTFSIAGTPLFMWLYSHLFQGWVGDKPGALLFALAFMQVCWLIGYAMDRRKIYIRL